jgi:hypothetical protein
VEQFPKKDNRLQNPDFQDAIKESERTLKLVKEGLELDLEELAFFIDKLETIKEVVKKGEDFELLMQEIEEDTDLKDSKKYVHKPVFTGEDIKKTKEIIKRINDSINDWIGYQAALSSDIDQFHDLERRFKEVLLKIEQERLQ